MSATVQYKGNTIATIENTTKTLQTEGKYMEGNVVITDVSSAAPTLQAKSNIAPTTSSQTITPDSGYDGLSSVQIDAISPIRTSSSVTVSGATVTIPNGYYSSQVSKSVSTGTAGTPTATKGTVNNHAISVTPSVTNSTGYITGGTKTGTAVTVSASELVSGTLSVTTNGTKDVTNYANVAVNVGGGATIEPLSVTNNGTYTPPSGVDGYSPIIVNVSNSEGTPKKQVNFIDYDGTIVASYTASEWGNVTALPSNPSHTGLTSQGWNWTKAQIDTQLNHAPAATIWVGQMYITESGDTEIDITLQEGRTAPYLGLAVRGTVVVDWGDGSATSTVTGSSLTTQKRTLHSYSVAGKYTITISVSSGSFAFYGSTTYSLLSKNSATANANKVYGNCVQSIRVGSGVTTIGSNAFYNCTSLVSVTIPNSVTAISGNAFSGCLSLASVTIPSGVTSIDSGVFYNCYSLVSVAIPSGVTTIGSNAFYYCTSLVSVAIPSGVTTIGSNAFYYCYSLASVAIPSGVTTIGSNAFYYCYSLASVAIPSGVTAISNNAFSGCLSLASVTIPSGVTSIGSYAFQNCYGMAEYHLLPTSPPTLSNTNAFSNIQSDCKIYVPSGSLSAYQSANNWSTYASYMVEE